MKTKQKKVYSLAYFYKRLTATVFSAAVFGIVMVCSVSHMTAGRTRAIIQLRVGWKIGVL